MAYDIINVYLYHRSNLSRWTLGLIFRNLVSPLMQAPALKRNPIDKRAEADRDTYIGVRGPAGASTSGGMMIFICVPTLHLPATNVSLIPRLTIRSRQVRAQSSPSLTTSVQDGSSCASTFFTLLVSKLNRFLSILSSLRLSLLCSLIYRPRIKGRGEDQGGLWNCNRY